MAKVIGLTASIGAGKTTVSKIFEQHGALVIDCDKIVADFYTGREAVDLLRESFATAVVEGRVRKDLLREHLQQNPHDKKKLEEIVHPIVQREVRRFIDEHPDNLIVVEIQLLFETEAQNNPMYSLDSTVVVDAPKEQRLARKLKERADMTEKLFNFLDSKQMPQEEKRKLADYIIDNSDGVDASLQVREIITQLKTNGRSRK